MPSPSQVFKAPWEGLSTYPDISSTFKKRFPFGILDFRDISFLQGIRTWLYGDVIDAAHWIWSDRAADIDLRVLPVSHLFLQCRRSENSIISGWLQGGDGLDYDIWMIPLQVGNNHWVLFVIIFKHRIILLLDSMHDEKHLDNDALVALQIATSFSMRLRRGAVVDWTEWTLYYPKDIPQQDDGSSCGVFVCIYAHSICTGQEFRGVYGEEKTQARQWLMHEIVKLNDKTFEKSAPSKLQGTLNEPPPADQNPLQVGGQSDMTALNRRERLIRMKPLKPNGEPPCSCASTAKYCSTLYKTLFEATTTTRAAANCSPKLPIENMFFLLLFFDSCKDYLHPSCIQEGSTAWLKKSYSCPSCRTKT